MAVFVNFLTIFFTVNHHIYYFLIPKIGLPQKAKLPNDVIVAPPLLAAVLGAFLGFEAKPDRSDEIR